MSLKHAILGFLSNHQMTGYDLKKNFDQSIQFFWPANQSQIYRTLTEMYENGLVHQEVVERDDRLDMKIYHITDTGREELQRWLSTPLMYQSYREAFLIQIYFGSKLNDQDVLPIIRHMISDLESSQKQLTMIYKMYQSKIDQMESPRSLFYSLLTLEYGIASNQAALNWLNSTHQRLEAGDYAPQDLSRLVGE